MRRLTPSRPSTQPTTKDSLQTTTTTNMFFKTALLLLLATLLATSYAAELPAAGKVSSVDLRIKEKDASFDQESRIELLASEHGLDAEEEFEAEMMSSDENKTMEGTDEKNVVRQRKRGRMSCRKREYRRCYRGRKFWRRRTTSMKAFCRNNCRNKAYNKCR